MLYSIIETLKKNQLSITDSRKKILEMFLQIGYLIIIQFTQMNYKKLLAKLYIQMKMHESSCNQS